MSTLTKKQELFVKEYIIDFNATRAAIAAGYSEDSAYSIGSENLYKPEIQEAIQKEMEKRKKRIEINQDFVLEQLAKIAGANIKDFIQYDKDGEISFKPYDEVDGQMISEISNTSTAHGRSKRVKLYDKMKALELLGKHFGMYKDVIITPKQHEKLSADDLDKIEQELENEGE
jgi:phage terminase small subunit